MPRLKTKLSLITIFYVVFIRRESSYISARDVSMKIVDEPSNFGYPYQDQSADTNVLKMRIQPSNFSGPIHMKQLYGDCFTKIDDSYKYEFCPFINVTQHEQSLRWNPYSGILGVWQEWEIVNNTYQAMLLTEGDACGAKQRSTKVLFTCGDYNEVEKVSEPETCCYELIFKTPLVCHPHAMLVYPTLSTGLQQKWDLIEGQYVNQELTDKGYHRMLHKLFEEAGLMLPETKKKAVAYEAQKKEKDTVNRETGNFNSLDQCSEEFKKLQDEIAGLRSLLSVYHGSNDTKV